MTEQIPMKQWRYAEADRIGISPEAVAMRLSRGKYPDLIITRKNQRVVFVEVTT